MVRVRVAASVLVVALVSAGCFGGGDGDESAPPGKAASPALRDSDETPTSTSLAEVCRGKIRLTRAAAYTGSAAHPVVFYRPATGNADPAFPYIYLFPPLKNRDQGPVLRPTSLFTVQLVGCLERVDETPAGKECDFDIGAPAPLYTGRYRYTMREAMTGKVLGETTLESPPECPGGARVNLYDPKLYSIPRTEDWLPPAEPFIYWNGQEPKPSLGG